MLLGAWGCTFIIQPPDEIPGANLILPLTCLPVSVNPLTGENQVADPSTVKRAQVIFTIRIERSTATLASTYERFMTEVIAGLSALGVHLEVAAILRLDERPVSPFVAAYGCGLEDPEALAVVDVLNHYAAAPAPPERPVGCAIDPLLSSAEFIDNLSTSYPPQLEGRSGVSVFGPAPDYLLVVHLDALARRTAWDEPGCAGRGFSTIRPDGALAWVNFSGEPDLSPEAVEHWFVFSDEAVGSDTLLQRCRGLEGVDLSLVDAVSASPRTLYTSLADQAERAGSPVQVLSICQMLAESARLEFLRSSLLRTAGRLGTRLNLELLDGLLRGEIPGLEPPQPAEDAGS